MLYNRKTKLVKLIFFSSYGKYLFFLVIQLIKFLGGSITWKSLLYLYKALYLIRNEFITLWGIGQWVSFHIENLAIGRSPYLEFGHVLVSIIRIGQWVDLYIENWTMSWPYNGKLIYNYFHSQTLKSMLVLQMFLCN